MIKIKNLINDFKKNTLIKGIFWSFLGVIASKGLGFLAMFFVARELSVADFGNIGILQSYITTFSLLSLASFGVTATKYIAINLHENKRKTSEIFSLVRLSSFLLAILVLVFSLFFNKELCVLLTGKEEIWQPMLYCSIAILFSSLNGLQTGALAGFENFKSISIINIVNGLLSFPLIIILTERYGVNGFAFALLITNFSIWLCSAILLRRVCKEHGIWFSLDNIKSNFDIILKFSLPAFISSLMVNPIILICNSILIKRNHNGLYEMGIFNASNNYSQISMILLSIIGQVFYPYAMKNFGNGNKKFEFLNIIHPMFFGLIICLPTVFLPEVFSSLFGSQYHNNDMYITTILVSIFTIINSQKQGIARNFAAGNFMWFSVFSNGFWGITAIAFSYLLVDYGAIGRGVAFVIAYFLNTVLFIPYFIKNKLVNKKLVLTWYNLLYFGIVLGGLFLFKMNVSVIIRVVLLVVSLLLVLLTIKRWYNVYIKN
ncbi:oligosaccharide flippase family protein [Chryseobacterium sp. LAM-KRS1]|uniref:oligosaccharide flippase family protein n=1 Tax=Chryseobacterium sp. LAM-KRS1 TaxID=2715754 RepID=UPI001556C79D|nr:oligosaccharide flippase family protein [Chryseobacterium sp. LAM-KRS1]